MKLDLGSGATPREGFVGIDLYCGDLSVTLDTAAAGQIVAIDLTCFPWPLEDDTVDEVWCSHFVEHLDGQWVQFVDELHRVLKPGAVATVVHPNVKSARAFMDPTHRDFIPGERWLYASREWRALNGLDHPPYPTCDFQVSVGVDEGSIAPAFKLRTPEAVAFALTHYWEAIGDVIAILTKV